MRSCENASGAEGSEGPSMFHRVFDTFHTFRGFLLIKNSRESDLSRSRCVFASPTLKSTTVLGAR